MSYNYTHDNLQVFQVFHELIFIHYHMGLREVEWMVGGNGLNLSGSGKGQLVSSCKCGNEPSCSI